MSSRTLALSRHVARIGQAHSSQVRLLSSSRRLLNSSGLDSSRQQTWRKSSQVEAVARQSSLRRHQSTSAQASGIWGEDVLRQKDFPKIHSLQEFSDRHIGPDAQEEVEMLKALDPPMESMDAFVGEVIPEDVRLSKPMGVWRKQTEQEISANISAKCRDSPPPCFIGKGYYNTLTPEVIKRNILESPAWYTSYTPYQAEVSQGRLESLLNFQTMVSDLTGLPVANASLLDEGTAAAEAMTLSINSLPSSRVKRPGKTMLVASSMNPMTIQVMEGRAEGFDVKIEKVAIPSPEFNERLEQLGDDVVGVMVQYPDDLGGLADYRDVAKRVHDKGALLSCATELLALTRFTPPGEWGADIAFGSSQRFGVPLGGGGPHAAFFAVSEKHKRKIPGRLVGLSKDRRGERALRLALQTREQHIRREKATSNVCTAQALPANVAAMYAVYHGPEGLKAIAESIARKAKYVQAAIAQLGFSVAETKAIDGVVAWDTVVVDMGSPETLRKFLESTKDKFQVRELTTPGRFSITVDESTTQEDIDSLLGELSSYAPNKSVGPQQFKDSFSKAVSVELPGHFKRSSPYLQHPVFNSHHSETELLRYIYHLQSKDLSLVHSMIPLGSCTMKLNGSVEMTTLSMPAWSQSHPAANDQHVWADMLSSLKSMLEKVTGMSEVTLEPNSGAQGEFAGLRAIRAYHKSRGEGKRDICLIPVSAHGTNPASAAMTGMRVVPIKCDVKTGNLDVEDLQAKCEKYRDELGAIMVTYPSTFGVFEPRIREVCDIVHRHGGQVYMDGANMNAQVGLCSPGDIGADVCHLNLHKTFCIPHGGGGPGSGPVCAKSHLGPFLPNAQVREAETKAVSLSGPKSGEEASSFAVSSAPHGSASILPISWSYMALMGPDGLKKATEVAILNANYLLARLKPHYPILYTNDKGRCAHEFILDARPFSKTAGVEAIDIAKRLQDYGFHAPTMSWPVANTLMVEPTESESKAELDRFADALISIRAEIREIEEGRQPKTGNVLKNSPHPLHDIIGGDGNAGAAWDRPYTREQAAYPLPWLREKKFWPSVARVDDTFGDLNLFCTCPPVVDTTGDAN
ncbi:uncharacterized protein PpBr36_09499 [Pyricularia pennisetigena]|uniref:uncharacterized protein n=1 Tax=Pyricularia pennisetigena TaxID=1578925 RepID=UPI0011549FDF|nr:uncharacterized protein PpBr36_09499 [Pyricularia pennisetigena]TLS21957.1 hypothetical protein PpBr36_09499 [Pyricularia pennisetigena]